MSSSYNIVGSANGHRSTGSSTSELAPVARGALTESDVRGTSVLRGRQTPRTLPTDINDLGGC